MAVGSTTDMISPLSPVSWYLPPISLNAYVYRYGSLTGSQMLYRTLSSMSRQSFAAVCSPPDYNTKSFLLAYGGRVSPAMDGVGTIIDIFA